MRQKSEGDGESPGGVFRREFVKLAGGLAVAAVVSLPRRGPGEEFAPCLGYLLVDVEKCQGCRTCMLACSIANEGRANLSLSRIQVIEDPFKPFPVDIEIAACRQCADPECAKECPSGALRLDAKHGNVRIIDREKCIGCGSCVMACPHLPARAVWNHEDKKAVKCDLCLGAGHWTEGGPGGAQACIESCPVGAIAFTSIMPVQDGQSGYKVNLRGPAWEKLGYHSD